MQPDSFYHNVAGCLRMLTHSGPRHKSEHAGPRKSSSFGKSEHKRAVLRHGSRSAGGVEGTVPRHAWTVPKQRNGLLRKYLTLVLKLKHEGPGHGKMLNQEVGKMVFVGVFIV